VQLSAPSVQRIDLLIGYLNKQLFRHAFRRKLVLDEGRNAAVRLLL
jgi:hypothetical protein